MNFAATIAESRIRRRSIIGWTLAVAAMLLLPGQPAARADEQASASKDKGIYLIIHADDAGMSHSVNRGTIDAMEKGIVSSCSIMVPCPWFTEFAEYARNHPEGDYGIHLTLNNEWRVYRWGPVASKDKVPSLVNEEGYLWRSVEEVARHAKADEVEIELRAQIDKALKAGIPLSHLDTHMGALLSRPDLVEVYVKLGLDYDLPVLFIRNVPPRIVREYPGLGGKASAIVRALEGKKLPVLDGVVQFYGGEGHELRKARYLQSLRSLGPGVHELIIHCGYDNEELRHITNSAARRDSDRRVFMDPEVKAEIEKLGIRVISWKQFRKMRFGDSRKDDAAP